MATHTVLLVEDDAQTRTRLAEVVATHPSLQLVDAVGNVAEGKAALSSIDRTYCSRISGSPTATARS